MNRQYAAEWVENDLHHHEEFCTALRAGVLDMPDDAEAETKPLEPHHDVIILGLPFKSLWDTTQNRIIGDIGLSPDLEPLTPGGPPRTEEQVRASPLSSQTWHLGYVLEPAANGRGIMSEVIGVLLESWVRPLMRIERVVAIIENNNKGSSIVVHRHGFKRVRDIVTDWPEEKGGGKRYSGYYIWKRGGDGSDDERVMRNLHNRHKAARAAVEFSSDEDGSEEEDGDGDDDGDNAADTSMLTPAANSEEDVQMHSPA
jgi:RimJ/RimL family protein N-acetyltransferase